MATFTGQLISATYDAIIKTIDNDAIGSTAKQLTDGLGNVTPLYVSNTQIGIGITPTEALDVSGNIKASLSVIATTFSGDLNGTINTATTGVTQTVGNDTTKIATTAFVQESHVGKPTGSGTGGKIALWSGSGSSTVLTDSSITEESTQYLLTKDIRIFDPIPAITLQDSDSSGSASSGDIQWLDNAASQRAIISLSNAVLGITSKHGGLNFGTNSTPALTIDGSQNAAFTEKVTSNSTITTDGGTTLTTKDYVDSVITAQELNFSGTSGTGSVDLDSQTFAVIGTANEIETSAGSQQLQIGLPDDVTIGRDLTVVREIQTFSLDVTAGASIEGLAVTGNSTFSGTITAPTFIGDLNGTINTLTTAVTQSANNNSTKVATTAYVDTSAGLYLPLAGGIMTGDTIHNDSVKSIYGTSSDGLEIYHDGSNSYIDDSGTGHLFVRTNGDGIYFRSETNEEIAHFNRNAGVKLFYDNSAKFETTSTGVSVTGNIKGGSASGSAWTDAKDDIGGLDVFVGSGNTGFSVWDDSEQTTPRFIVERTGNVGISTDSPEQKLHVEGASITVNRGNDDSSIAFQNSTSGATWRIGRDYSNSEALTFAYLATDYPSLTGNGLISINTSGNVGIGGSPNSKLQVVGAGQDQIRFGTSTSVYTDLWMGTGYTVIDSIGGSAGGFDFRDDGTSRLFIDSSGNVGINQTPSATSSYMVALQIGEQANVFSHTAGVGAGSATHLANNITHNGGYKYINNDTGCLYTQAGGNHTFGNFPSGTAGAAATEQIRMQITSGGEIKATPVTSGRAFYSSQDPGNSSIAYTAYMVNASTKVLDVLWYGSTIGSITVNSSGGGVDYNTTSSDERLKKNITNWDENILDKFKDIKPKEFNFNTQDNSEEKIKGYIAQNEVDKFPEAYPLVYNEEAKEDRHLFNPSGMTVYLMKAIQELTAKVEMLEKNCNCK